MYRLLPEIIAPAPTPVPETQFTDKSSIGGRTAHHRPATFALQAITPPKVAFWAFFLCGWLGLANSDTLAQQRPATPDTPEEQIVRIHGSGTMQPLFEAWAAEFSRIHPGVKFELRPEGSLLAFAMLAEKTPAIGGMSRPLLEPELAELAALGVTKVWQLPVARDQIAVVAHPTCPVSTITLSQLQEIFGSSAETPPLWRHLVPVDDSHKDAPLVLVGPNELSGTHAAFQRQILADQTPLTNTLVSCDSHTQILERVAHEPQGLGFLSAVWLDDNANVLAIAADQDSPAQLPSNLSGSHPDQSYPLERDLFLVFSGGPDRQLTATERAFLEFVLSEDGLILVQRTRFVPLPPEQLAATRQQLAKRLLELN